MRDKIDSDELRQGNFVAVGYRMTRIIAIRQKIVETNAAHIYKTDLRGMRLTAQILQDFGFVRGEHPHLKEIWDIPITGVCRLISATPNGEGFLFLLREPEKKISISLNFHHYVHEMQNLYFDIKKEHLQYNGQDEEA